MRRLYLAEWRAIRGLSQVEASGLAGIRQGTWSAAETGRVVPHILTLKAMSRALRAGGASNLYSNPKED